MNRSDHSICDECWKREFPNREAHHLSQVLHASKCCWCSAEHHSGIFVWQMNHEGLQCKGVHEAAA